MLVALGGLSGGAVLGGPVAAVAVATYAVLGVRAVLRSRAGQQAGRLRRQQLDRLCGVAADLRAGLPVPATSTPPAFAEADRIARLTRAAVQLADRTGAPLAELVERIEADARSTDRGLEAAAAQAAGARATAWLLAALPLGGVGLGYGIGVDPVAVLLHTPLGGASAIVAVVLQTAGLFWTERLTGAGRGDR
ncbi:type II secretion system F family protein [Micromonospora sp. NPDC049497]|uniref:type II secretion system F family protein n=1 Tax=Micromonospora sp. NPDC049497 TaxID=3364273 RepID=UPI00378ED3B7